VSATVPRRTRPPGDLAQTGVVALLRDDVGADHRRMAGMDAGPGSDLGGPGWFAATWALMMAAMMLPAVAPMVAAYRGRTPEVGRWASASGDSERCLVDVSEAGLQLARR
jgi:predicted metal-binding membrane protein